MHQYQIDLELLTHGTIFNKSSVIDYSDYVFFDVIYRECLIKYLFRNVSREIKDATI